LNQRCRWENKKFLLALLLNGSGEKTLGRGGPVHGAQTLAPEKTAREEKRKSGTSCHKIVSPQKKGGRNVRWFGSHIQHQEKISREAGPGMPHYWELRKLMALRWKTTKSPHRGGAYEKLVLWSVGEWEDKGGSGQFV